MKHIKMTLSMVARSACTTVASAIEEYAAETDWLAAGTIGSTFACSGPGSGWQKNFDVNDYAERALSDDFGATHYIDSSDGRVAESEGDGIAWSDESMVELVAPDAEDACDNLEALKAMVSEIGTHDDLTDMGEWKALRDSLRAGADIFDDVEVLA